MRTMASQENGNNGEETVGNNEKKSVLYDPCKRSGKRRNYSRNEYKDTERMSQLYDEMRKKLDSKDSNLTSEERRKLEEDANIPRLLSDGFCDMYRRQRKAAAKFHRAKKFGKLLILKTYNDYLRCKKEPKDVTVIIHVYKRRQEECDILNECLDALAEDYPTVKFAKICSSVVLQYPDYEYTSVPVLETFKGKKNRTVFPRIIDNLPKHFDKLHVENFLVEKGIIVHKFSEDYMYVNIPAFASYKLEN